VIDIVKSNYDKFPVISIQSAHGVCDAGWDAIAARLRGSLAADQRVTCVEIYPGAFEHEIEEALTTRLRFDTVIHARDAYKPAKQIMAETECDLTDDPVFGRMTGIEIADFMDSSALARLAGNVASASGKVLVIGTGASLLAPNADILIYADMARWEIQLRQRKNEVANLGLENFAERPSLKYKRAYFFDWRAADRLKKKILRRADFVLDTNARTTPKMIPASAMFQGLRQAVRRPFRVVPFFDPGPWGGQWMKEVCDLPREAPNYAWCFDCVPEENSLLLGFRDCTVELPSINLVFEHPRELLGDSVHGRFGTEFPIRFDFLDTMGGGNLSFQVHPLTEYIQERFGIPYTQDESYYLLDAKQDGCVYLGMKEGIDREAMIRDLHEAQTGAMEFPAEKYVNRFPARKHDHFLIPAGTPHCSGRDSMVLEISATPYIFTFKMWDWGRLGLDGRPRPIHLEHGIRNIQWDRTTTWVKDNLVNSVDQIAEGLGWREERTGLHEREFIETRRHWFTGKVAHDTGGGVNVLNLVEGREAIVESPTNAFEPFVVHYAETFIVPAAVGPYTIRPYGQAEGTECATIKASVRSNP
jgi:mannose-6-phosphate isomerase class I